MDRLYRCKKCWDVGWLLVDGERNVARPCTCDTDRYARWEAGEYAPQVHKAKGFEDPVDPATFYEGIEAVRRTLDPRGDG